MISFKKDISEIISKKDTTEKLWQLLRLLQGFPELIEKYFEKKLENNNEDVRIDVEKELKNKFSDLSFLLGKVLETELKPKLNKELEGVKNQIIAELEKVRQIKLIPAKAGITPIKGKDYFTKQEIQDFLNSIKPVKGKDYFDGAKGEDGKNINEDKIVGKILSLIPKIENGKDGSPDTSKEIVEKINSSEFLIDASKIKNLPRIMNLGGRGGSGAGTWGTAKTSDNTLSGAVNGSNTIFTILAPINSNTERIYVNGQRMDKDNGDYTISGSTITLTTAPPTGSVIICDYEKA